MTPSYATEFELNPNRNALRNKPSTDASHCWEMPLFWGISRTPACKPSDSTTKQNICDFYGVIFSVLIQERVMPVWEHGLLISCSYFMILSLKTLRLHSDRLYLHLDLLCFCLNCMPALRNSAVRTDFLCLRLNSGPCLAPVHSQNFCSQIFWVAILQYGHDWNTNRKYI